jgi:HEAT repeat protein
MRVLAALACLLAVLATSLPAIDEALVLSAARAANAEYQNRFNTLALGLQAPTEQERIDSVRALGELRDPKVVPLLVPWLLQSGRSVGELVIVATVLGHLGFQTPVPQLRHLAGHEDPQVRMAAVSALHQIGAISAGDWMLRAKEDEDALRLNALAGLGHVAHAEAAEALILGLSHEKPLIRQAACIGLGQLGDPANGGKLKAALTDPNPMVRRYAAEAIAKLGYRQAIPDLLMALEANVAGPYVLRAVRSLTGQDFGFDPQAPLLMRQEAIERAFQWLTTNPVD